MRKAVNKSLTVILLVVILLCGCKNSGGVGSNRATPTPTPLIYDKPGVKIDEPDIEPDNPTDVPQEDVDALTRDWNNFADVMTCCSFEDCICGQTYEQEPVEGLPVYAVAEPERIAICLPDELTPGQSLWLNTAVAPKNAYGRLTFSSLDESIATVDEYGKVTGIGAGEAIITATAANGVSAECTVRVNSKYSVLTYELTDDKTGYVVTGCSRTAFTANIPATYQGLPVKEIAGRAFIDCTNLRYFTTDADQEYFYTIDGVLFTDNPVKTLVRMPNRRMDDFSPVETYTVPDGTVAIGDYAFAGFNSCYYGPEIFLPESVTTMGDCVFCETRTQADIYVTDSLTSIGEDIMLNQYANVPFYGNWGSYAAEYAEEHNIPFGGKFDRERRKTDVMTEVPSCRSAEGYVVPDSDNILFVEESNNEHTSHYEQRIDLAEEQRAGKDEIRLLLESGWYMLIPDKNGNKSSYLPAMTGVYGMGYTEEPMTLVAYSLAGKPIAMKDVEKGDFVFAFEGAANIGVVGGKSTYIVAYPYEPMFVTSSGYVNLAPEGWKLTDYGTAVRIIVSCYSNASYASDFPIYLNVVSYMTRDSVGNYLENSSHYFAEMLTWSDDTRFDLAGEWSVYCDGLDTVYDSDTLICYANSTYGVTEDYGRQADDILKTLIDTMVGNYYPADAKINKITVSVDGSYPASSNSRIGLDEGCKNIEDAKSTLTHEMVHAVDQSIWYCSRLAPSPWLEGRAEYIGRLVDAKIGAYESEYPEKYDWSFLTEQDRQDFLHFYCLNNNRQTPYIVGYYFLKYLNETYGDDISGRIMKAMSEINCLGLDYSNVDDITRMNMFGDCVKSQTCETVFQDFVRDVVEK